MARKPRIVAAIPAYNVESFIGEVVRQTRQFVDETVVVNDGSTDNTAQVAQLAGAVVVSHRSRQGYGGSVKTCFEFARKSGADVLVTLDGDAQHNPAEIQGVAAPVLNEGVDLVIGSRLITDQTNMPRYRRFGIGVITFLVNFGSKVKLRDAQSGFRAYSKRVLNTISVTESGMAISVETIIKAKAYGLKIREVPISCRYHKGSSSKIPVIHGLEVALSVVRLRVLLLFSNRRTSLHIAT